MAQRNIARLRPIFLNQKTSATVKKLWLTQSANCRQSRRIDHATLGEVAEWPNAPVLKTDVPQGTGGSNPPLSALLLS